MEETSWVKPVPDVSWGSSHRVYADLSKQHDIAR